MKKRKGRPWGKVKGFRRPAGGYESRRPKELEQLEKDKAALDLQLKALREEQAVWQSKNQEMGLSLQQFKDSVQGKDSAAAELRQVQQELLKRHTENLLQIRNYEDKLGVLQADKEKLSAELTVLKSSQEKYLLKEREFLISLQEKDKRFQELKQKERELSVLKEKAEAKNKDYSVVAKQCSATTDKLEPVSQRKRRPGV